MPESSTGPSIQAAIIARKHYLSGISKSDLAAELGISRFKVARLLDDAVRSGLVKITVETPIEYDFELGEHLASRYGIRTVLPVRVIDKGDEALPLAIGAAAGQLLEGMVGRGDVLGISWGHTMSRVVEAISRPSGADVVQIAGGISSDSADISGVELARRLAAQIGGRAYPLLAPLLVGTRKMAHQLRSDASLSATISRYESITIAVMGIGSWNPPQSMVYNEATPAERADLRVLDAAADVSGIVMNSHGVEIESALQARRIGITRQQLLQVQTKVAVAGGVTKAPAIAAALRSGMLDILVTDSLAAKELLALT